MAFLSAAQRFARAGPYPESFLKRPCPTRPVVGAIPAAERRHVATAVREQIVDDVAGKPEAPFAGINGERCRLVVVRERDDFEYESVAEPRAEIIAQRKPRRCPVRRRSE